MHFSATAFPRVVDLEIDEETIDSDKRFILRISNNFFETKIKIKEENYR